MTYLRYIATARTGRTLFAAGVALLMAPAMSHGQDAKKPVETKKPDAGKFNMTIQGTKAGTCTFKYDADGGSEATAEVDFGGQSQKFTVKVKAKADKIIGFSADAGKENHFTATVEGGKAKLSVNDGAVDTQTLAAGAVPFGNFSPHLINHLIAAYDAKKAGAQPVSMVLVEGLPGGQLVVIKGKVTSKGAKDQKIDGKTVAVTSYLLVVETPAGEVEIKLYANADKHLLAWDVPSQKYTAVREGFEDVLNGGK